LRQGAHSMRNYFLSHPLPADAAGDRIKGKAGVTDPGYR